MDIFTDASLNDHKKIAGVGAIFVPSNDCVLRYDTYCSSNNIQTAELFAIAFALRSICRIDSPHKKEPEKIRVVTDSINALKTLRSIFTYPDQYRIRGVEDLEQKRILYNISETFSRMRNAEFLFQHVKGHQNKPAIGSDGYYNIMADQAADAGRMRGETNFMKGIVHSDSEEEIVYKQDEVYILAPAVINFQYNINPSPVHQVAHHKDNRDVCIRQNLGRKR